VPKTKLVSDGTFVVVFVSVDDIATSDIYRRECERRGSPFHYVHAGVGIQGTPPRVPVGTLPVMIIAEHLGTLREWYKGAEQLPWEVIVEGGVGEIHSGSGAADIARTFDLALQRHQQQTSLTATSGR